MFNIAYTLLGLNNRAIPLLKLPVALNNPPPVDPLVSFSFSQFLVALISGLLVAFAFQFLLTNLSVALVATPGIATADDDDSLGDTIRGIETKVGFFILSTATIALSVATFLAVKLSLVMRRSARSSGLLFGLPTSRW
jgi:hypothetical protein